MFDLDVLQICKEKVKYEQFQPFIKEHTISPESWKVFKDMGVWFTSHEDIDWTKFKAWFKIVRHPADSNLVYDIIFSKLLTHTVDEDIEKDLTASIIGRDYATRIADKSLSVAEGSETVTMEDVLVIVNEYESVVDRSVNIDASIVTSDIHELIASTTGVGGVNWRIPNLNEALGALRKGDFVVVGARPDSGKTSFLASEATNFLPQIDEDQTVMWFNNEEGGAKVKTRCIGAGIDWDSSELSADPLGALEKFKKECGSPERLVIIDDAGMPNYAMEQVIKKYNPGVIIFDQLWKVPGFFKEAANEVMRQTMLFNWGREMAKKYAPVITVHQAGGSVGGEKWIPMEALYGSQTGIQGEADAIITIGRTYDSSEEKYRFFYIPKNKMYGTNRKYRNGKFVAELNVDTGRFNTDGSFETT